MAQHFDPSDGRPRSALKTSRWPTVLATAALLAAVIGGGWWWLQNHWHSGSDTHSTERADNDGAESQKQSSEALPPGAQAGPALWTLLERACDAPGVARWLATDDIIRRLASAVESVARGGSPSPQLAFLEPRGRFRVYRKGGRTYVHPYSYRRYRRVARTLQGIDVKRCAQAYPELKPWLQRAYREIGRPDERLETALAAAITRLLAVPVPKTPVALRSRGAIYVYADSELEALSPAAKHLLRMGPKNMRIVQTKLRAFAQAIGLKNATKSTATTP